MGKENVLFEISLEPQHSENPLSEILTMLTDTHWSEQKRGFLRISMLNTDLLPKQAKLLLKAR